MFRFLLRRLAAHLLAIVLGPLLLALPVHAGSAFVIDVQAIGSDVALTGLGIPGNYRRQRDEAPAVLGPALQDREIEQREFALLNHFLAGARGDFFGEELT